MRHSKIDLTMNVYTDPKLLDVQGTRDALPALPLGAAQGEGGAVKVTGTAERARVWLHQPLTIADKRGHSLAMRPARIL
jgi:hypothetical protein